MNENSHIIPPSRPPAAFTSSSLDKGLRYAGFWQRFGAYWIDVLCLLPLVGITLWLNGKHKSFTYYLFIPNQIISLWFQVYLVKKYGGTPGNLMLGIRIARLDGSPVGYREAILRYSVLFALTALMSIPVLLATWRMSDADYYSLGFLARNAKIVAGAPSWYGLINTLLNIWIWSEFIVMLTNKRRRSLQDFMAGTIVIRSPKARATYTE